MERHVFERIRDEDMIHIRSDGAVSWDSQLQRMLDPDVLEMLLTCVQDNIGSGVDGDEVEWAGVSDDLRKEGLLCR